MRVALWLGLGGVVGCVLGMLATVLVARFRDRQRALGRSEGARASLRDVPTETLHDELSRRDPRH